MGLCTEVYSGKWDEKCWKQGDAKMLRESHKKELANFYESQNNILTLTVILLTPLH